MAIDPEREKRIVVVRNRIIKSVLEELKKGDITAPEALAVMAHSVGALIALQDKSSMLPETALQIVQENIEGGNAEAVEDGLGFGCWN